MENLSKKYLNIMKKIKLDLIYPEDELDINTWTLWDPGRYHKLIKLIKIISKKYLNEIEKMENLSKKCLKNI